MQGFGGTKKVNECGGGEGEDTPQCSTGSQRRVPALQQHSGPWVAGLEVGVRERSRAAHREETIVSEYSGRSGEYAILGTAPGPQISHKWLTT